MNTSNLHAANATSVLGNAMSIPPRVAVPVAAAPVATPASAAPASINPAVAPNAAAAAAAAAAQLQLNQIRAAFKPTVAVAPSMASMATMQTMQTSSTTLPVAPAPQNVAPAAPVAVAAATSVAASLANPAVPNTAGAGALNLSGRWYLDRDDSDSTNDYLEAMGLPLIARQAADKLDLMVVINQSPGDFIITRRTRIFMETKHLKFGQDVNVKGNIIKVVGDADHIRTVTQLSGYRGMLLDHRTMDDQGRMLVDLTLQLPDRTPVVTRRYFKKTSDSISLDNLPPFDISLETAGDVKRKR